MQGIIKLGTGQTVNRDMGYIIVTYMLPTILKQSKET